MTATLDLDLTNILCRYVIDPDGSLRELPEELVTQDKCGVEGGQAGDSGSGGAGPATSTLSTPSALEGLEGVLMVPRTGADPSAGLLGVPPVPEVAP
jgi:phospholipid/cholesterol/gamma-HCH transport system substrate-binding protein